MGANMPKQYLPLRGQPIALYSLQTFAAMPEVGEVVVVCDPSYRDIFQGAQLARKVPMKFALPGASVAQRPFPSRMSSRRFVQPPLRLQCAEHFARCRQGTPGQRIQRAASNRLVCRAGCSARLCAAAGDEARCVLPISVRTCRSGGGVATRFMLQS